MRFFLRILTVFCYFLPFCFFFMTCQRGVLKTATNANDAIEILEDQLDLYMAEHHDAEVAVQEADSVNFYGDSSEIVAVTDSAETSGNLADPVVQQSVDNGSIKTLWTKLKYRSVFPVDNSLSAFGIIIFLFDYTGEKYYMLFGVVLAGSMLISLLCLFFYRYLVRKQKFKSFILGNIFCMLVLMFGSFIIRADLLIGFWCLFILLIIQYFLELIDRQKNVT